MLRKYLRFFIGLIASVWIAAVVWSFVSATHRIFQTLALSGLVPWAIGGIAGGIVAAVLAPNRKLVFAFLVGCAVAVAMLSHLPPALGRNPWLWYAPAYTPLFFAIGGFLGRRYWREDPLVGTAEHG